MRLFTALELTEEVRAAVAREQARVVGTLGRGGGRLRLVRPEHLHVTLVFIGEVEEERANRIVQALTAPFAQAPFRLGLGRIAAFPPRGAPRVLYLGTLDGAAEAASLHGQVAARLEAQGVPRETRPYHPHVTLGRWRESRPSDRPADGPGAPVAVIDVTAVALLQSRLSPSGPAYTRLASAPLSCP